MDQTSKVPREDIRNITLMFSGKLFSLLGASMYTFICGLYILKLTGSGSQFAVTLICGMLPRIILGPVAGVLADRLNRRKLIIGSDLASVAVMLLGFFAVAVNGPSVPWIYATLILLSVCSSFYSITISSSLLMLVEERSIQKAGSMNQMATSIGNILGPVCGGFLFAFVSLDTFMLMNAAGLFISSCMGYALRFRSGSQASEASAQPTDDARPSGSLASQLVGSLAGGFGYVRKHGFLWSLLLICFWVNFFASAIGVTLPYIMVHSLGMESREYGVVDASFAAGMLVMAAILSVRKNTVNPLSPLLRGLILLSVLIAAMSLPYLPYFGKSLAYFYYIGLMMLIGVVIIYINIPLQVLFQTTIDPEYRGRVFGIIETMAGAIAPLGTILYGVLLDWIPAYYLPAVSGISLLAVTLIGSRSLRLEYNTSKGKLVTGALKPAAGSSIQSGSSV
ncbi:MFS transporter [Paenibacillus sp. J22TS3]|uniref:MFS transporter n=1 Tax=Paenibacillus sp. J22TS3 TaxID=2807192 RepID=UPI001B01FF39|nr:MFS transporter [Paenibacillus sp. J22TS3]GIP24051.1 MFS transporter [Paenibacillus sp. J22TS3]